ncbi:hypothetical protein [Providencia manganoxydans]|uniref:hypothetical protein n=1 Tax=Providencia manganoxydans TaxID=2923283 RepID=UPI0034E3EE79
MKQENNNVAFITPNAGIYVRTDIASVAKEYPALWLVVLLSIEGRHITVSIKNGQ